MKKFFVINCILFFFSSSIMGQVSFMKKGQSYTINSDVKISVSYYGQPQKPCYLLYFSNCSDKGYTCSVSISLGDSKYEALTRLSEIKDALATGNQFSYRCSLNLTYIFTPRGGNTYSVYYDHLAYFSLEGFQGGINWLQNLKE